MSMLLVIVILNISFSYLFKHDLYNFLSAEACISKPEGDYKIQGYETRTS